MSLSPPTLRELSPDECREILARHNSGRLAFTFHDRVDIEPTNDAMLDNDLVFRTSPGAKVDVLTHHPWVAFEVDEVKGLSEWRNVVVHGTIRRLEDAGSKAARAEYDSVVEQLRSLVPPGSDEHPLKHRPIPQRLHVAYMTGRESSRR